MEEDLKKYHLKELRQIYHYISLFQKQIELIPVEYKTKKTSWISTLTIILKNADINKKCLNNIMDVLKFCDINNMKIWKKFNVEYFFQNVYKKFRYKIENNKFFVYSFNAMFCIDTKFMNFDELFSNVVLYYPDTTVLKNFPDISTLLNHIRMNNMFSKKNNRVPIYNDFIKHPNKCRIISLKNKIRDKIAVEAIVYILLCGFEKLYFLSDMDEYEEQKKQNIECKICLQEIIKVAIKNCGHTFCKKCIFKFNNKCPVCRTSYNYKDVFNIYIN